METVKILDEYFKVSEENTVGHRKVYSVKGLKYVGGLMKMSIGYTLTILLPCGTIMCFPIPSDKVQFITD